MAHYISCGFRRGARYVSTAAIHALLQFVSTTLLPRERLCGSPESAKTLQLYRMLPSRPPPPLESLSTIDALGSLLAAVLSRPLCSCSRQEVVNALEKVDVT